MLAWNTEVKIKNRKVYFRWHKKTYTEIQFKLQAIQKNVKEKFA